MEESVYGEQIVVIGGGPGGYVAAIRAAQLGASVTVVEKGHLGGTCLNVGCIPTKALLHAAEFAQSARDAKGCGVHLKVERIDWRALQNYQNAVVQKLRTGLSGLLRGNRITVIEGTAAFLDSKTIRIRHADGGEQILRANRFILATGSVPTIPPIEGLSDSRYAVDSSGVLAVETLPSRLVIIGGGAIGVEFATALNALGCRVTIVEALPKLGANLDAELCARLAKSLEKQGIALLLKHKVVRVADKAHCAQVVIAGAGAEIILETDLVLYATGRRPCIDGLNLEACGVLCEQGRILTDARQQTAIPGIYAVGDCTSPVMLAHVASAQGEVAAENAMGGYALYQPACVPSGIYGSLELAGVGLSEEQAASAQMPHRVGRFQLAANGRALIDNGGEGMVKVIVGNELDELLGVHILAPNAMELIGEAALAITMEGTVQDLIGAIHAHPTVAEAIREAALTAQGRAIHAIGRKERGGEGSHA